MNKSLYINVAILQAAGRHLYGLVDCSAQVRWVDKIGATWNGIENRNLLKLWGVVAVKYHEDVPPNSALTSLKNPIF